jgi:hypothetical protein
MLAKCATTLALRRAFPLEMGILATEPERLLPSPAPIPPRQQRPSLPPSRATGQPQRQAATPAPVNHAPEVIGEIRKRGEMLVADKLIGTWEEFKGDVMTQLGVTDLNLAPPAVLAQTSAVIVSLMRARYLLAITPELERTGLGRDELNRLAGRSEDADLTVKDLQTALKALGNIADAEPAESDAEASTP